jgi:hypothetical protein
MRERKECEMTSQKPVHEIRVGMTTAAIWENTTSSGLRYSIRLSRIYRDGEEWKRSESFGRDELPLVGRLADMAHTWIHDRAD